MSVDSELKAIVTGIKEDIRDIQRHQSKQNDEMGGIEKELATVKTDIKWIRSWIKGLKKDVKGQIKESIGRIYWVLAVLFIPITIILIKTFTG